MTDDATRALAEDVLRDALYYALLLAKVNGSPVHEHLGDLLRAVTPDTLTALAESGHGIAPLSVIEAGEAVERLPDDTSVMLTASPKRRPDSRWWVTIDASKTSRGPTLPEAVRAALKADR